MVIFLSGIMMKVEKGSIFFGGGSNIDAKMDGHNFDGFPLR